MISFHRASRIVKMLRISAIFLFCLVAAHATGDFIVLNSGDAIAFEGSQVLKSNQLQDVLAAVGGVEVSGEADWPGLSIKNPFNLPANIVVLLINGARTLKVPTAVYSTKMSGNDIMSSLDDFNSWNETICRVELKDADVGSDDLNKCIGENVGVDPVSSAILDQGIKEHNNILRSIGLLNAYAKRTDLALKSAKRTLLKLDLSSIVTPKEDNKYVKEALKLTTDAIINIQNKINEKDSNVFFLAVTNEQKEEISRKKREILAGSDTNKYNLATYYGQNYPVIFNIILWFMVAFGLSLLAICYAIADMDPGRDSIIYRMTSTRMKKEN